MSFFLGSWGMNHSAEQKSPENGFPIHAICLSCTPIYSPWTLKKHSLLNNFTIWNRTLLHLNNRQCTQVIIKYLMNFIVAIWYNNPTSTKVYLQTNKTIRQSIVNIPAVFRQCFIKHCNMHHKSKSKHYSVNCSTGSNWILYS